MGRNQVLGLAALIGLLAGACAHERPEPTPKPPPPCNYRVLPLGVGGDVTPPSAAPAAAASSRA